MRVRHEPLHPIEYLRAKRLIVCSRGLGSVTIYRIQI